MAELSYLVLRCSNLGASRAWFEALGFQLSVERHGSGPEHYSLELGSVVLELYPSGSQSTSGARLGLKVSGPVAASNAALKLGGKLISSDAKSVVLRDPDGHTFELMADE